MKASPLLLFLAGVQGQSASGTASNGANAGIQNLSFGFERASRCAVGTHNCHEDAVCTFRRGAFSFQCTCRNGYTGDGEHCEDVNECLTGRHDCTDNEACINTVGSYHCKATKGGSRTIGAACYDGTHACVSTATCVPDNNEKGYDCMCFEGFGGNGFKYDTGVGMPGCTDVDECAVYNTCNQLGQKCVNTYGSFVCSALPDPFHVCTAGAHECHEMAICIPDASKKRGYDCECVSGYKGNGNAQYVVSDGSLVLTSSEEIAYGPNGPKGCVDIDECKTGAHQCVGQTCVNQPGGFYCSSEPDPNSYCAAGNHECHHDAVCVPSDAFRGYDCICKDGLVGNGNSMTANDFFGDKQRGKKGCQDVNECKKGTHNCIPEAEVCHNVHANQGKFLCLEIAPPKVCSAAGLCPVGYSCYEQSTSPFYACVDDNECDLGLHDCTVHQSCVNSAGSHYCIGVADPNNVCNIEDNPCADDPMGLTTCVVTDGSYTCSDPDNCAVGAHNCPVGSFCVDLVGTYECRDPTHPDPYGLCENYECQEGATCLVSDDKLSRTCACNVGYAADLTGACIDQNECDMMASPCPGLGDVCVNNVGSYECMTAVEFSDFICSTDGCDLDTAVCTAVGDMDAYVRTCVCPTHYVNDLTTGQCVDEVTCPAFCTTGWCIEGIGEASQCDLADDPLNLCGLDISDSSNPCGIGHLCQVDATDKTVYTCTCSDATTYSLTTLANGNPTCEDINECADESLNSCSIFEVCKNLDGGFDCDSNPDPFGKCQGWNNKCASVPEATCEVSADKMSSTCRCPPGYYWGVDWTGTWGCNDIDECSTGEHKCTSQEYCANIPGSYTCLQHEGPCAFGAHECHAMAICRPSYAKRGYDCDCINGYHGNGNRQDGRQLAYGPNGPKGCVDIDECKAGTHQCVDGQTCVNQIGKYECSVGYDPLRVCAAGAHNCHPLAACIPTDSKAGFECTCKAGFYGTGKSDGISYQQNPAGCVDVDECATGRDKCSPHQQCVNLNGGYSCSGDYDPFNKCATSTCQSTQECVPNPYVYSGFSCQDVDECLEGTHTCTPKQLCVNTNFGAGFVCRGEPDPEQKCAPGSAGEMECSAQKSACIPAMNLKGFECIDIDECSGSFNPCAAGQNCINQVGGYVCTTDADPFNVCDVACVVNADCTPSEDFMSPVCECKDGYIADLALNDCVNVDECKMDSTICDSVPASVCVDNDGSYSCSTDADPFGLCTGTNPCIAPASCSVNPLDKTVFTCDCGAGYQQDSDFTCADIDECATGALTCPPSDGSDPTAVYCVNSDGGAACSADADPYGVCAPGAPGATACFLNGACQPDDANNRETFICVCDPGFNAGGPLGSCIDDNECDNGSFDCSAVPDSVCVNTPGSYVCDDSADPFGVCAVGAHKCGQFGTCVVGASKTDYTCTCFAGFELDVSGPTCVDIDECLTSPCVGSPDGEDCVNTEGSFECRDASNPDPNGLCDPTNPNSLVCIGVGAECTLTADLGSAFCACPAGFFYQDGIGCVDIDECLFPLMNICTNSEKCVNTVGSYSCQPSDDPLGRCDGVTCDANAECYPAYNTKAGYDCVCNVGWYGNGNFQFSRTVFDVAFGNNGPKGCKDVDECELRMHNCEATGQFCYNTPGSYTCTSEPNVGHPCQTGQHECHHLAECQISYTNKVGYTCECQQGFRGNGKKQYSYATGGEILEGGPKGCVDLDECKFNLDNCQHGQICYNNIGSYHCYGVASADPCQGFACETGLQCQVNSATGAAECMDTNECLNPSICPAGTQCSNSYKSYSCIPSSIPINRCAAGNHACSSTQSCDVKNNQAVCVDRNECFDGSHDCTASQNCFNTNPGFLCFNDATNACMGSFCHSDATCVANSLSANGYDCVCNSGFTGSGKPVAGGCVDVDECAAPSNPCSLDKICRNIDGGYYCANPIHTGDAFGVCSYGAHDCDDLAACVPDHNAKSGYQCICAAGYKGNGKEQQSTEIDGVAYGGAKGCVDVDECKLNVDDCSAYQYCFNLDGAYTCLGDSDPFNVCAANPCSAGFTCQAVPTYQGYKCIDENECMTGNNNCEVNQFCLNLPGTFACQDTDPIMVIGQPSGPLDPSDPANPDTLYPTANPPFVPEAEPCLTHTCADGWKCVNVGASPLCLDINECYENDHACGWGQICSNFPGGFLCLEDPDYVCRENAHTCNSLATCVPSSADKRGYECMCPDGYFGNGNNKPNEDDARSAKGPKGCTDVDECEDPSVCPGEICVNFPGSHVCLPADSDVTAWEHSTPCFDNDCDDNADCILNPYSPREYDCVCRTGYKGNGNKQAGRGLTPAYHAGPKGCVNVDECSEMTHTCGATEGCIDTDGGFLCINDPYGVCKPGKHTCNAGSNCMPKPGALWDHECHCKDNYRDDCLYQCGSSYTFCYRNCVIKAGGSGNICVDVDECAEGIHDCTNSIDYPYDPLTDVPPVYKPVCVNREGSGFECSYDADPFQLCAANGPCPVGQSLCSTDVSLENRDVVVCTAEPGWVQDTTTFADDGIWKFVNVDECTDITICDSFNDGTTDCTGSIGDCICMDNEGSYECNISADPHGLCSAPDNWCTLNGFGCLIRGAAKDEYYCDCGAAGLMAEGTVDGVAGCVDVDECADASTNNCGTVGGWCVNTVVTDLAATVGFECSTEDDPLGLCDNMDCGATDAVAKRGECVVDATQKDIAFCQCEPGFEENNPGLATDCLNIDECINPLACDGVLTAAHDYCIDTHGSFECTDEVDPNKICVDQPCGWRGVCTIIQPERKEFACGCEQGYEDICMLKCFHERDPHCYASCVHSLYGQPRCQNINECITGDHGCMAEEDCTDLDGSYTCVDKCGQADNLCHANATCVADYSEDGYHCLCAEGFHGKGNRLAAVGGLYGQGSYESPEGCVDIDECELGLHNCVVDVCINTEGSFYCTSDPDPLGVCDFSRHNCHPLATCIPDENNELGYTCECQDGLYGDGQFTFGDGMRRKRRVASGLEYLLDNNGDGARSMGMIHTLVNAIPSYEDVRSGQSAAPKGCINIDECFYELDNCADGEICIDNPMPTGPDDKFFCFPETTTPPPPTISPTACFMAQRECDPDADCYNHPTQPGDVMCKCRAGLEGNGELSRDERGNKNRGCKDIDECKEGTHNCQSFQNEFCNNLFGTFDCIFNERCNGPTKCHPLATCMPLGENDYTCSCPEGYSGDGMGIRGCLDIDECDDGSNMCHPTAFCFNKMGGYECKCPDLSPIAIMEECPDDPVYHFSKTFSNPGFVFGMTSANECGEDVSKKYNLIEQKLIFPQKEDHSEHIFLPDAMNAKLCCQHSLSTTTSVSTFS
ncbi:Oidioi.mRNA.OKI2018_I69.PAR.g10179.t1.cds [Oikopleura dioica]|uniref:Oidioi.mRNA.OKI2018_I69.PAR.g10179.t1.cds n=1 Tax=Oikopleura dioica TaxID=34765 RepID=A0ABN7RP98_OIKDI|nr:Oidioi.mRNA.OKI2018_I69.PAR.g10179.t1.cds [Oikopleura dioica]